MRAAPGSSSELPPNYEPPLSWVGQGYESPLMREAGQTQMHLMAIAEHWMHQFYYQLSSEPASVADVYLEDAEVIYTGQDPSVDAEHMSGKKEISGFFRSATAAKFEGARVMVEALHPLPSPLCPFGLVIFLKGKIWFRMGQSPDAYSVSTFFHFVLLVPQPKSFSWKGVPPSQKIANEYFHLTSLPMSCNVAVISANSSPQQAPVRRSLQPMQGNSQGLQSSQLPQQQSPPLMPTVVTQSPPVPPDANSISVPKTAPQPPEQQAPPPAKSSFSINPPHADVSLHANPTLNGLTSLTDSELRDATNVAIKAIDEQYTCLSVSRPQAARSYFFIRLDSTKTRDSLRGLGQVVIRNVPVILSPVKSKTVGAGRGKYNSYRGSERPATASDSTEQHYRQSNFEYTGGRRSFGRGRGGAPSTGGPNRFRGLGGRRTSPPTRTGVVARENPTTTDKQNSDKQQHPTPPTTAPIASTTTIAPTTA